MEADSPQTRLSTSWQTQIRTSNPSACHGLDHRSEIPRSLAASRGRRFIAKVLKRPARDADFLNFVPVPYPFGIRSELPRKSTRPQLSLGVARGVLVETGARDRKRQNESIKPIFKLMHPHRWRISTSRFLAHAQTPSIAATHRTSQDPQAEIWSLIPSSRTLDNRAGKIPNRERGVFQIRYHQVPSSNVLNGLRKIHKTFSLLQLRRKSRSRWKCGTNSLKEDTQYPMSSRRARRASSWLATIRSLIKAVTASVLRPANSWGQIGCP